MRRHSSLHSKLQVKSNLTKFAAISSRKSPGTNVRFVGELLAGRHHVVQVDGLSCLKVRHLGSQLHRRYALVFLGVVVTCAGREPMSAFTSDANLQRQQLVSCYPTKITSSEGLELRRSSSKIKAQR